MPVFLIDARGGNSFHNPGPFHTGAFSNCHGCVNRVHRSVILYIKPRQQIIDLGQRKKLFNLVWGNFLNIHSAIAVKGSYAPVFFQAVFISCGFNEPNRFKSCGQACFSFQAAVEVAGIFSHCRVDFRR